MPYFVYSFIQCWILRLVLPFGYCGQYYSEHGVQTICSASVLAFLSSVYPEIELLSYTVILFNFLQNYHTYFLQYLHHFIYPPVVYSSFQFSIFASTCPVSVFFFLIIFFICFWLCWVFTAGQASLQLQRGGGPLSRWCSGFSLRWSLLQTTREVWASVVAAPGL